MKTGDQKSKENGRGEGEEEGKRGNINIRNDIDLIILSNSVHV